MDSLSPNYQTIAADGRVTAEFTGVIHAEPGSTIEAEALEGKIQTSQIEDEAISTPLLAANAVTAGKVAANAIEAGAIKAGAVTTAKLEAEAVSTEKLAAGAVTAGKISVTTLSAISANLGTVTAGTIEGGTIIGGSIESTTITAATIRTAVAGARVIIDALGMRGINASNVTKISFDTTTGIVQATAVISTEEGSVIQTKHLAGQITETQIEDEAISTPLLAANAVTAAKISVSKLSAVSADLGTITAGSLTAVEIEASVINATELNAAASFSMVQGLNKGFSNQLQWRDGGEVRAGIASYFSTNPPKNRLMDIEVKSSISEAHIELRGRDSSFVEAGKPARVTVTAGAYSLVLIDEEEAEEAAPRSDFPQLTETARRTINAGVTEVTWPGGSAFTNEVEVTHGLGQTPKSIQLTVDGANVPGQLPVNDILKSTSETKLKVQARANGNPAASTKAKLFWQVWA